MKSLATLSALALVATGTAVVAQTTAPAPTATPAMRGGGKGMNGLRAADANRDGVTTRAEASAEADRRFAALDANHDGKVTPEEMQAARDARRAARAAANESRGGRGRNRTLTQSDFRDRSLRMFDRVDTNHDGKIDQNERDTARLMMRARMADHTPASGDPSSADDRQPQQ